MTILKTLIIITLLGFVLSCNQSQHDKFDNSILWEIKNKEIGKTSYLLGTQHLMDTSKINFPIKTIESLIDRIQYVYVELNIPQKRQASMQLMQSKEIMADPDSPKLPDCLRPKYQEKLKDIIESSENVMSKIEPHIPQISPQALCTFLMMEKMQTSMGEGTFAPDDYFERYAKNNQKGIMSLEKASDQMKWLMQEEMEFSEALKQLEIQIDLFSYHADEIYDLYENQDIAKMAAFVEDDSVNIKRNINMARRMDITMQDYSVFTMVGAAHLSGINGILTLLEDKGYELSAIEVDLRKK